MNRFNPIRTNDTGMNRNLDFIFERLGYLTDKAVELTTAIKKVAVSAVANLMYGIGTSGYFPNFASSNTLEDSPLHTNGTDIDLSATTDSTSKSTGSITTKGGIGAEKAVHAGTTVRADSSTDATDKDSGAIIATAGGIAAEKQVYAGTNVVAGSGVYIGTIPVATAENIITYDDDVVVCDGDVVLYY